MDGGQINNERPTSDVWKREKERGKSTIRKSHYELFLLSLPPNYTNVYVFLVRHALTWASYRMSTSINNPYFPYALAPKSVGVPTLLCSACVLPTWLSKSVSGKIYIRVNNATICLYSSTRSIELLHILNRLISFLHMIETTLSSAVFLARCELQFRQCSDKSELVQCRQKAFASFSSLPTLIFISMRVCRSTSHDRGMISKLLFWSHRRRRWKKGSALQWIHARADHILWCIN